MVMLSELNKKQKDKLRKKLKIDALCAIKDARACMKSNGMTGASSVGYVEVITGIDPESDLEEFSMIIDGEIAGEDELEIEDLYISVCLTGKGAVNELIKKLKAGKENFLEESTYEEFQRSK